jgi:predicted nuclease of predicted toxin-antitoxin system
LIVWVDAQLAPALAPWLNQTFGVEAFSARFLGLQRAKDQEIFAAARSAGVVVISKDRDFVLLVDRLGPPPQVIWLTCGNTANERLRRVLTESFPRALELLRRGEPVVEVGDRPS